MARRQVVVRDAAKGTEWSKSGAEVAVGDLGDVPFLASALKGASGFFALLPPNYQVTNGFYAVQRKAGEAFAAAVKQSGVPHVVALSSIGADLPDGTGPIKALYHFETR